MNAKFNVSFPVMEQLFSSKGIFHNCQKEGLLSKNFLYYITLSEDKKYLLLVMKCANETNVLTACQWNMPYDKDTNPWLQNHFDLIEEESVKSFTPEKSIIKIHYGIEQWT